MTVDIEDAWRRGDFRVATDASAAALAVRSGGDPFRDGVRPIEASRALHDHGRRCWHLARFDEARRCLQRAYDLRASTLGAGHPDTLSTLERLAALDDHLGESDVARQRFDEVITGLRAADQPAMRVAVAQRNLAAALRNCGDVEEAAKLLADDVRPVLSRLAENHPDHVDLLKVEATRVLWQEPKRAFEPARRAAVAAEACWGDKHPFTAAAHLTLASAEIWRDDHASASTRVAHVIDVFRAAYGPHTLLAIAYQVQAYCEPKRHARTRSMRRAFEMYRAFYPTKMAYPLGESYLDALLEDLDLEEAESLAATLEAMAPAQTHRIALRLASTYVGLGLRNDAARWLARGRTAPVPDKERDEIARWIRDLDAQLA